jgi:hypothetical protein
MLSPTKCSNPPKQRVVRFSLTRKQTEQMWLCCYCPMLQRQRRQRMMARRRFQKLQNEKLGITKYEHWLTSTELKALQSQCLRDVSQLVKRTSSISSSFSSSSPKNVVAAETTTVNDDDDNGNADDTNDILSLSRFLSCRRKKKSLIQHQLMYTIRTIQKYHQATMTMTAMKSNQHDHFDWINLMASICAKHTKSMVELAHVEGLYWHLHVMLQPQKTRED